MHIMLTVQPDGERTRRSVRAAMRGKLRRLYWFGGALAAIGAGVFALGVSAAAALIAMGAVLLAFPWLLPRAAAKARTGIFAETATYELTDTTIQARTPSLNNGYNWTAVDRVEDTGEFWVVMVKGIGALVLPWTLLSPSDAAEARSFLTARGLLA